MGRELGRVTRLGLEVLRVVMYFDSFFLMLSFHLFLQASLSLSFGSLVDSGGPAQCPNSGLRSELGSTEGWGLPPLARSFLELYDVLCLQDPIRLSFF